MLLLSGDINLNPGPPATCSVCAGNVNKRNIQCEVCLIIRTHKKCTEPIEPGLNYKCKNCLTEVPDISFPNVEILLLIQFYVYFSMLTWVRRVY